MRGGSESPHLALWRRGPGWDLQLGAALQTAPTAQAVPMGELTLLPYPDSFPAGRRAQAALWSLGRVGCTGKPLWTHPTACHPSLRSMGEVSGVPMRLMASPAIVPPP